MNNKKEDTPMRITRRKYEEKNKEKRKQTNAQFSTFIPREDFEEINTFLKENKMTKVELIYAGYTALRQTLEEMKKN